MQLENFFYRLPLANGETCTEMLPDESVYDILFAWGFSRLDVLYFINKCNKEAYDEALAFAEDNGLDVELLECFKAEIDFGYLDDLNEK